MPTADPLSEQSPDRQDDWRVGADDVAMGYRVFLGREPEDAAVLHERAGQLASDMLNGFVNSGEFRGWTVKVIETTEDIAPAFMRPAEPAIRKWVTDVLRFDGDPVGPGHRTGTLLELVAMVLATPLLRRVIDGVHGDGEALRLHSGILDAAIGRAESMGASDTSPEDIGNLYRLILGRPPETAAAAAGRAAPLYATVIDFLASSEFATKIVPAALARRLDGNRPLSPRERDWVRSAFGLPLGDRACRQDVIVSLLRHRPVAERLRKAKPVWSLSAIAEALTLAPPDDAHTQRGDGSFAALLESSGLFDPQWYADRNEAAQLADGPLRHFLDFGAYDRRDPGPNFDTAFYLRQNPDAATSRLAPLEHYLRIGRARGAASTGPSSYARWVERFDALTATDCDRIAQDAATYRLPPVTCVHIRGADGHPDPADSLAEQRGHIGVEPQTRYVGGVMPSPGDMLDDIADDEIIIIVAEPCRLRPHACYLFARMLTGSALSMAYSDHDHLIAGNRRERPIFKPAMAPDFMRSVPYAGPVVAVKLDGRNRARTALAIEQAAAGNVVAALAGLLLAETLDRVGHLPFVLYSIPVDSGIEAPPPFSHEPVPVRGLFPPAILPEHAPNVCILIPSRDHRDLLSACIASIFAKTRYPAGRFEIVVIDNETREHDSVAYLQELAQHPQCRVIASPGPFNFARICNEGAAATTAEILVFLNNDMTVRDPDWLTRLVAEAVRPEIGIAGGQLLYPDDTVQHGGVIVGVGGFGAHRLAGLPARVAARFDATREMTTMTGACIAVRRAVFDTVGGFDTALGVAFNDVALCMRVVDAGYRNLYLGQALLYHHEAKSRGRDDTPEKVARNFREAIYTRERFRRYFQDDAFYSPNLSLEETGALSDPPRIIRPWRRTPTGHVLLLSGECGTFHGVADTVAAQAREFLRRGWVVTVGHEPAVPAGDYPGCRSVVLGGAAKAAGFAVAEGVDCIIAHTPPFFSVARYLGRRPLFYIHDHGASPAEARLGEDAAWEKRFYVPFADRVFATSETVRDQQYRRDTVIVRNGNDHFATWNRAWPPRRAVVRRRYGFAGVFVVLSRLPDGDAARASEIAETYGRLAAEFRYAASSRARSVRFVLIGGDAIRDAGGACESDVEILSNLSADAANAIFAAADLYVSLQEDVGYDCGLAQAAAMGLDAIGSDSAAHRERLVVTAASMPRFCQHIEDVSARWDEAANERRATVVRWQDMLSPQVSLMVSDLAADRDRSWL